MVQWLSLPKILIFFIGAGVVVTILKKLNELCQQHVVPIHFGHSVQNAYMFFTTILIVQFYKIKYPFNTLKSRIQFNATVLCGKQKDGKIESRKWRAKESERQCDSMKAFDVLKNKGKRSFISVNEADY